MKATFRLARRVGIGTLICLVLLVDFVLLRVWDPAPLETLRARTFDVFQTIRPREVTARPVVIVDLDEASFRALGQWPWPRTLLADLVNRIAADGAVATAFDVVYSEPDRSSPDVAAATFRGLDESLRERLRTLPNNDAVLAEAMRQTRVVLSQSGYTGPSREAPAALPGGTGASLDGASGAPAAPTGMGFALMGPDPTPYLVSFQRLLRNIPALEEAAAGRGLFTIRPERDGVIRRVPLVMLAEEVMAPALSLEVLRVATGSDTVLVRTDAAGVQSVSLAGVTIPTDLNGQLWIHFSPHDPSRFVSAVDVIEGRVPPGTFTSKLALVGTSAVGLLDLKTTPVDAAMPGVEVHAQVIENVLTQSVLWRPNYSTLAEIAVSVLLGLAIIALSPHLGAMPLFFVGGAIAALVVGLSWYWFVAKNILFDLTFPLIASFSIYLTVVFTNYLRAHRERRRIRLAFQQYLSPALVEQLAQSPEKLVLGGEHREMTVMFSDVRGFTSVSELYRDDPQGLTALMNRFLTPLTNAIIHRQGTIDKYMGDNIMAFWNAPLFVADHELHACEAALDMLDALAKLNADRESEAAAEGRPFIPLRIGIGLNAGPCVVGNMGSDLHFNYSVLGDTVNLASRLEGQSKRYGVPILVGSRIAEAVGERLALLELDRVRVVGKSEPELVYTVLGREEVARNAEFQSLKEAHAAMLAAYRGRDWAGALEAMLHCRERGRRFGIDALYETYVERIRAWADAPPPMDWDGVYVAETK